MKNKLRAAFLQNIDIVLIWIPSHVGILGNETVDLLAKNAISEGRLSNFLVPHTDFYASIRASHFKIVEKSLLDLSIYVGTSYFNNYSYSPRAWFSKFNLNRFDIVTVSRIRSNHYNSNYSLFRCNIVNSPFCDYGFPYQDINHILWHCPLFNSLIVIFLLIP